MHCSDVSTLALPNRHNGEIDPKVEKYLLNLNPTEWPPIVLRERGRTVLDGVQRVLIARKYNIKLLPSYRLRFFRLS